MPKDQAHRVSVTFSKDAYETLERLARDRGETKAEVLRDAIALERLFFEVKQEGGRVLVERPGADLREVILR